ncbi:DUF6343 family protein [Micromonospora carbonacea]|jgi:hypothetical protein|uniref:Uncharacterized protein n=1 Tax=Micromonospora carbonacea TaxID=47853 RepID=A0A1C4ZHN7_9ACTN|nr:MULTISPECIES: DUF6343 family protein [Micromonospora]MBB5827537.1 putative membrane protein YqjE [Micromonospora carbonacea]MDG4818547.1 DUF6343 family protein [Micromonospora sp. WMMD956]QLD24710.1 hypothetical protein HXZ27_11285 [Micromonospora carbonacea]SCF32271.1 hypothetical protein GA0070563_108174 [Micromonospora carbonacea]
MTRSQPRRARGTVGHAYSALNLRLVLAGFGLVTMVIFAVLAVWAGVVWLGVVCVVFAVVAAVDLVVIQRRRAARRRESPGARHSLFE